MRRSPGGRATPPHSQAGEDTAKARPSRGELRLGNAASIPNARPPSPSRPAAATVATHLLGGDGALQLLEPARLQPKVHERPTHCEEQLKPHNIHIISKGSVPASHTSWEWGKTARGMSEGFQLRSSVHWFRSRRGIANASRIQPAWSTSNTCADCHAHSHSSIPPFLVFSRPPSSSAP